MGRFWQRHPASWGVSDWHDVLECPIERVGHGPAFGRLREIFWTQSLSSWRILSIVSCPDDQGRFTVGANIASSDWFLKSNLSSYKGWRQTAESTATSTTGYCMDTNCWDCTWDALNSIDIFFILHCFICAAKAWVQRRRPSLCWLREEEFVVNAGRTDRDWDEIRRILNLNISSIKTSRVAVSLLVPAGNCMSLPVVGSVILAVLAFGDLGETRRHFRQGVVPTPTSSSQATTLILGETGLDGSEDSDESDGAPQEWINRPQRRRKVVSHHHCLHCTYSEEFSPKMS